ncbi:MAG TPA: acyltransferase, partial [Solirubrobacterales bacterium]|nr:acyltransferase [Solirubrobacterales bacterium]
MSVWQTGRPASLRREEETADVVSPPPLHPRFPLTVGMRGIPAIAIIVGHAWFFTGGFGGFTESLPNRMMVRMDGLVALFFLLSAFLLYRPMIAHRTGGPAAPKVGDYAKRRFIRLYPAYWVALTSFAIFVGIYGAFSSNWWAFYSLTDFLHLPLHNVCPEGKELLCGLPQSWTLGVDMTFYVLLPFYAALAGLLARGRETRTWVRWELVLLVLIGGGSLILGGPPFNLRNHDWFRFSALGHLFWFSLGLGLAVVSTLDWRTGLPKAVRAMAERPLLCWGLAAGIYTFTVLAFYPAPFIIAPFIDQWTYNWLNLIQGVAAVLLFVPGVFGNPNRGLPNRLLGHPVLMWVGLISYGLLLWNTTIAVLLGDPGAHEGYWTVLLVGGLLTVPLATASYYLVERPLMK